MKKVHLFLADGFEEVEALAVVDILRRAEFQVTTVSIMETLTVMGSHGIKVIADRTFEYSDLMDADMLILPGGGGGAKKLGEHEELGRLLAAYASQDKWLAAICAAPGVLGRYGLLEGKKATCYPGHEKYMTGASPVAAPAVLDGHIITGRGMGTTIDFALLIVEVLESYELACHIKDQILYRQ